MNSCAMRRSRLRAHPVVPHVPLFVSPQPATFADVGDTNRGTLGGCTGVVGARRVGTMALTVTATEFDASADLPDWRVLLGRIEATFRTGSFEAGAAFVGLIAAAAEAADH